MKILLTGGAGFIGMHVARSLVEQSHDVVIIDNLNDYYSPQLKLDRLSELGFTLTDGGAEAKSSKYDSLVFYKGDLVDKHFIMQAFERFVPDIVINLAAQADARYSLKHPDVYVQSNVVGFLNVLEATRQYPVKRLWPECQAA